MKKNKRIVKFKKKNVEIQINPQSFSQVSTEDFQLTENLWREHPALHNINFFDFSLFLKDHFSPLDPDRRPIFCKSKSGCKTRHQAYVG
jgi:hypothetical protein